MRMTWKTVGLAVAGVLGLLLAAVAVVVFTFDPNALKGVVADRLQRDHHRTLVIADPIRLSLFPRLALAVGRLTVSEQDGPSPMASVESARVSLALLPLLRGEVVADHLQLSGLELHVTRFKDGRTSVDDLLQPAPAEPSGSPSGSAASAAPAAAARLDVGGISLTQASFSLDDRQAGRQLALSRLDLETGRLAPGRATDLHLEGHLLARPDTGPPQADADLDAKANLLLEPGQRVTLSGLFATAQGRLGSLTQASLKLQGGVALALAPWALSVEGVEIALDSPDGPLALTLAVPSFRWPAKGTTPTSAAPPLEATLGLRQGTTQLQARLKAELQATGEPLRLASPQTTLAVEGQQGGMALKASLGVAWSFDTALQRLALTGLAIEASLPNPRGGSVALKAQGTLDADLPHQAAEAHLAGTLDGSSFETRLAFTRLSPAAFSFAAQIDRLDLDRYRMSAKGPAGGGHAPPTGQPIDLSALQDLDASGTLRVGALQVMGLKASQLAIDWKAHGGRVALDPIAAELYQGHLAGRVEVQAGSPARFSLQNQLTDVRLGPLLQDMVGKDPLTGRGSVALELHAEGQSPLALQKSLAGRARLELREGAVRGFDIGQALRGLKARIGLGGSSHGGAGSQAETTEFSELTASLAIAHGVAHNDDLLAKSPLLRVTGSGDIDLAQSRLDYLVKATVVPTLQGQSGPELQALRGQTIPVRLSGPLAAIGWKIEFGELVKDLARSKVQEQLGAAKDQARQQLGDKLKGLLGR